MSRALEQLRRDVSYGARIAARNRSFTAAAVLTLALGIGAATAIFSIADAIVFRPLPYADVDRLVKIWGSSAAEPVDNMSLADFKDPSERTAIFEQAGDRRRRRRHPSGEPGRSAGGHDVPAVYADR